MWIESHNRVYGRTRNAYDPHRTAGGSSGGEGAAVGSGGSPVGLGSDIGGSIRLPAFFNGVFGHKPSPGLVPNTGQFPSTEGEAAYMLTLGPLARHAEDLMPVTKIIAGPDGQDERCVARELGDPRASTSRGPASCSPTTPRSSRARKELRDARDQAAKALEDRGATLRARLAQAAPARARDLPRRARATGPARRWASCSRRPACSPAATRGGRPHADGATTRCRS